MEFHHHFSKIACRYKDIRTTDIEPILFIKRKLKSVERIEALDVGCGVGRYDMKLFEHLGERLYLICIDGNEKMLGELWKNIKGKAKIIKASAEHLPLSANSLNCIFTFNAIHHFKLLNFLKEVARVLRINGYLFIYTRLRSQNKKNIWGTHFPKFHEMERRLYELNEFKKISREIPYLELEAIEYFKYRREASLEWLVTQARAHHYSTFCLYKEEEFEEALKKFKENIISHYRDPSRVVWNDENIMFVIKKTTKL